MRVLFQLAICICLIILAGGTIHYIHDGPTLGGGILLIAAWVVTGGLVAIVLDHDHKKKIHPQSPVSDANRIDDLEKRLTDIQEIAIAMDEKMSRIEAQSGSRNEVA